MSGPGGAREQVARLLTLVPYLHARGEVSVGEAAQVLGVTPQQVVKDLRVLFMVGLPDGYPDDLIDVDLDALEGPDADGVIRVSNADYLARPLRLTATEATAVMVALLALRGGASEETRAVVDSALGKLQAATDGAATIDPGDPGDPGHEAAVPADLRADLERAVREQRQVRLTYWVPARDEETERVVDPRRLVSSGGAAYLDAWCRSAEDDRLFRLDRIHAAEVLDAPATHTAEAALDGDDLFDFASGAELVTLELDPPARWVVEYYPVEESRETGEGRLEVDLLVADRRWLTRLLLRLAPHARVRAPEARHREFTDRARETLGLYGVGRVQ